MHLSKKVAPVTLGGMLGFLLSSAASGLAIWIVTLLAPESITMVPFTGDGTWNIVLSFLAVGVLISLINAIVRPIVKIVSLPLYIITLGLWSFVVNGFLLWLVSWISTYLGWGLQIHDFWWSAIWAAFLLTLVNLVINIPLRAVKG